MVIVVSGGDKNDVSRLPEFYDPTFDYLRDVGLHDRRHEPLG
ncbi:MAG: hypothetical protein ACI8Z1_003438 [Candidatus Azotimanducaceae bacterium]|jgi:hypothetical protein